VRLWSIHPSYLDSIGLVALWREALLAQKVLQGETKGYKNHPQLIRFKEADNSLEAIGSYLQTIWDEAKTRGYSFDKSKIFLCNKLTRLPITDGQLKIEFNWLYEKLKKRSPEKYSSLLFVKEVEPNFMFDVCHGPKAFWEKVVIT